MDLFFIGVYALFLATCYLLIKTAHWAGEKSTELVGYYKDVGEKEEAVNGALNTINCRLHHVTWIEKNSEGEKVKATGITVWRNENGSYWAAFPVGMTNEEVNTALIDAAVCLNRSGIESTNPDE